MKIFANYIEPEALEQVHTVSKMDIFKDSKIRIMPDVHAGAGCVIGFTADLVGYAVPNLVGVDIGCGVLTIEVDKDFKSFALLDEIIKNNIPSGFNVHKQIISELYRGHNSLQLIGEIERVCKDILKEDPTRHLHSIGTLGGGNHFIEWNEGKVYNYLVIHSGSRNFGHKIATHYQKKAIEKCSANVPKELKYLEGKDAEDYLRDMKVAQEFAVANRGVIGTVIVDKLNIKFRNNWETVHNFIDESNIIRKGAISAAFGEYVTIPINMRDGSIIGRGKGNPDWNYSAPHGAGRLMSRNQAKRNLDLEEFKKEMTGIYSSTISEDTLDEAPMAYKPIDSILDKLKETVEIVDIIKPLYNFKG